MGAGDGGGDMASTEQDEKVHTWNTCVDIMHGLYLHAKIKERRKEGRKR